MKQFHDLPEEQNDAALGRCAHTVANLTLGLAALEGCTLANMQMIVASAIAAHLTRFEHRDIAARVFRALADEIENSTPETRQALSDATMAYTLAHAVGDTIGAA